MWRPFWNQWIPEERQASPVDIASEHRPPPPSVFERVPFGVIESAGAVAFVTAVLYFMGYSYYAGFFARLSLPPPYPELGTSDYFLRAFSSLDGFIVAALVSIPFLSVVPTTIWQALWVNAAFIIVPLFLAEDARSNGFLDRNLALLLGAVVVASIVASLLRLSVVRLLTWRWGLAGALAYGFGVLLFFSGYFRLEGTTDATRFIEGRLHPSTSVVVRTSDPESPVDGERLLVALMRGGFYLVRQQSPAPDIPIVYYVPESEVRSATMQAVGSAPTPPP